MIPHRPIRRAAAASLLVLGSFSAWSGDPKADGLLVGVSRAVEEGRWADAERALRQAREAQPDRADLAAQHAVALARVGRSDEALAALTDAARLGYASPYEPRGEEAFEAIRSDARFVAAMDAIEKNDAAARRRVTEADRPLPALEAPAFSSFSELRDTFAREERVSEPDSDWASSEVKRRQQRMRKIAALERYLAEHPEAEDRSDAALEALRAWRERTGHSLLWPSVPARDLATQATAFEARYGTRAELAREARFYGIAARACASASQDAGGMLAQPTATGCESSLAGLAAMAADAESGPWGTRAAALHAVCLEVVGKAVPEAFRAAQTRWRSAGLHDANEPLSLRLLDGALQSGIVAASLRVLGAPNFTLTSSLGEPVSLHGLRGKVVLVDFWSPG